MRTLKYQSILPSVNGDWVAVNNDFWDLGDKIKFLGELLEEQLDSWSRANLGRSILSGSIVSGQSEYAGGLRDFSWDSKSVVVCCTDASFSWATTSPPPVQIGADDFDTFLVLILCGGSWWSWFVFFLKTAFESVFDSSTASVAFLVTSSLVTLVL